MGTQSTPEQSHPMSQVVARAWQDPTFHQQLVSDPVNTLRSAGVDVPEGASVQVHTESPTQLHVVIPPAPHQSAPPPRTAMICSFVWRHAMGADGPDAGGPDASGPDASGPNAGS
jgi:hypothetical protein